jgi:hypothetical protein
VKCFAERQKNKSGFKRSFFVHFVFFVVQRSVSLAPAHQIGPDLHEDLRAPLPPVLVRHQARVRGPEEDVDRQAVLLAGVGVVQV